MTLRENPKYSVGLKAFRDQCVDFFKNENAAKYVRDMMTSIGKIVYDEIYVYIWFICIYNVFLIFITLANLYILQKILKTLEK
jgi:hypothetical protein